MTIKYVSEFKVPMKTKDGKTVYLLWGDPVHVNGTTSEGLDVTARKIDGYIDPAFLMDSSNLLEIYVIDVGQGDGILFRTPNNNGTWHLVDAGIPSQKQMTKQGAVNFLRWKFIDDLQEDKIKLENVIISHPDFDHYGGLDDLNKGELTRKRSFDVEVENFYHSGLGRFSGEDSLGENEDGEVADFPKGDHEIREKGKFFHELLDDKTTFQNKVDRFSTNFKIVSDFVDKYPTTVKRLDRSINYLPGYAPGQNEVTIHVLGPVLEEYKPNKYGLRQLTSISKTINGHSVILRLDYKNARILLTGDLNQIAHRLLFSYIEKDEFAVDVNKSCHHGSEDIDMQFMKVTKARATVISSGDNENYSHPKPLIIGASGKYGRESYNLEGEILPPMVYSTELARSILLGNARSAVVDTDRNESTPSKRFSQKYVKLSGDWMKYDQGLKYVPVSKKMVYGLINIRTDGENILCATMKETGNDFDVQVFKAGVDVKST